MQGSEFNKILIVDDVAANIKILMSLLQPDYEVYFAKDGVKALALAASIKPDIILLDIVMPDMDGYETCKLLKRNTQTTDIPVIFISAMNEVKDETKGLEMGAVDYITKPFSPAIVKARIKNHLKLSRALGELKQLYSMALDASPLTGLPGNNSIAKRIERAIKYKEPICVLYLDLDHFKPFNDKYGFAKGDEVLLFCSRIIQEALTNSGVANAFVGHIGGDDFLAILPSDKTDTVTNEIIRTFDNGIVDFYSSEDRRKKFIISHNRRGERQTFPIVSISMAGVDLTHSKYEQYIQVNDACSEAKKRSKDITGSSFVMDRRVSLPKSKVQWKKQEYASASGRDLDERQIR